MFCRVRPLLREDRFETNMVVSYPTSIDMLDRGIELVQNGTTHISYPHVDPIVSYKFHAISCLVKYHEFSFNE